MCKTMGSWVCLGCLLLQHSLLVTQEMQAKGSVDPISRAWRQNIGAGRLGALGIARCNMCTALLEKSTCDYLCTVHVSTWYYNTPLVTSLLFFQYFFDDDILWIYSPCLFAAGVWGMDFHRLKENSWIAATVLLSFFSKFSCWRTLRDFLAARPYRKKSLIEYHLTTVVENGWVERVLGHLAKETCKRKKQL